MLPPWDQFVVVTALGHCPKQAGYRPKHFFPAETCARHVYVGLQEHISEIPSQLLERRAGTEVYCGAEAYKWFMEFYCGLKGHHLFELHVAGQVQNAWQAHREKHPGRSNLSFYMDTIFRDGALIREQLPSFCKRRATFANSAVEVAALGPEKTALVIGGDRTITSEIITALGHKKKCNPSLVAVAHPDRSVLNALESKFKHLPTHERLDVPLSFISTDLALDYSLCAVDAVFVCQPMVEQATTSNLQLARIDQFLCEAWRLRCEGRGGPGKILHLAGNPADKEKVCGGWQAFDHNRDGFVPYAMLKAAHRARVEGVKQLTQSTSVVIDRMGEARIAGQRIRNFTYDASMMTFYFEAASGPRIRNPEAYRKAQTARAQNALTL